MSQPVRTPLAALVPGLLGLLPFWGFALATVVDVGSEPLLALMALIMYGAIILSFVGALHWAFAMTLPTLDNRQRNERLIWSVMPAVLGWRALLMPPLTAAALLVAGVAEDVG